MLVSEIPAGSKVGIDSNVFVYHFCGRSNQCTTLLQRVEAAEVKAVTSRGVLIEVLHRLMVLEALQLGVVSGANPARRLKGKPQAVRSLRNYYTDATAIFSIGVEVLPPLSDVLGASQPFREMHGLLTNDSILAATLLDAGVTVLATADGDFERVDGLTVATVTDLAGPPA